MTSVCQTAKRVLGSLDDVAAGAAWALPVAHVHAEFGRQRDLVATALENLAEQLLAGSRTAIDIGGVEERHAFGEGGVDDGSGAVEVKTTAKVVAPQTDDRDVESGGAKGASGYLRHPTGIPESSAGTL
jgi:hypothetical protein